jgi:hypothetical protein
MSDEVEKIPVPELPKKLGMFDDPKGDFSSGRFIKVGSYFIAVILAGLLAVCLFTHSKDNPADPSIVSAISISIGVFMGCATGAEIAQKASRL